MAVLGIARWEDRGFVGTRRGPRRLLAAKATPDSRLPGGPGLDPVGDIRDDADVERAYATSVRRPVVVYPLDSPRTLMRSVGLMSRSRRLLSRASLAPAMSPRAARTS